MKNVVIAGLLILVGALGVMLILALSDSRRIPSVGMYSLPPQAPLKVETPAPKTAVPSPDGVHSLPRQVPSKVETPPVSAPAPSGAQADAVVRPGVICCQADAGIRIAGGTNPAVISRFIMRRPDGLWAMYLYQGDAETYGDTGYATSADGITWTMGTKVMTHGGSGFDNTNAVITAVVVLPSGRYRAYCEGMQSNQGSAPTSIFVADSADGLSWTKGQVLFNGNTHSGQVGGPRVYADGTGYILFFNRGSSVLRTSSSDGISWASPQSVIDSGVNGFDMVRQLDGGWRMFAAKDDGSIGSLTSANGITWTWDARNILSPSSLGVKGHLGAPVVVSIGGVLRLYVTARPNPSQTLSNIYSVIMSLDTASTGLSPHASSTAVSSPDGTVPMEIPRDGWLGLGLQPMTNELAKSMGLKAREGALVNLTVKGGPADKGGIKIGDVIIKYDGNVVKNPGDLVAMVTSTPPGAVVKVVIERNGQEQPFRLTIEKRPKEDVDTVPGDWLPTMYQSVGPIYQLRDLLVDQGGRVFLWTRDPEPSRLTRDVGMLRIYDPDGSLEAGIPLTWDRPGGHMAFGVGSTVLFANEIDNRLYVLNVQSRLEPGSFAFPVKVGLIAVDGEGSVINVQPGTAISKHRFEAGSSSFNEVFRVALQHNPINVFIARDGKEVVLAYSDCLAIHNEYGVRTRTILYDESLMSAVGGSRVSAIGYDPQANLVVLGTMNNRLVVGKESGGKVRLVKALGSEGFRAGQFEQIRLVAVDAKGNIYVVSNDPRRTGSGAAYVVIQRLSPTSIAEGYGHGAVKEPEGWLGPIEFKELTGEMAARLNLPLQGGLMVKRSGGALDFLQGGTREARIAGEVFWLDADVLLAIDGKSVREVTDVQNAMEGKKLGDRVDVVYWEAKSKTVKNRAVTALLKPR